MAPRRLYELPNEQLVRLLAESRARGLSFEAAWDQAIRPGKPVVMSTAKNAPEGCVRWPTDSSDRITWQAALIGAKDGFRRAYLRRPQTVAEVAVVTLVEVLVGGMDYVPAVRSMA